MQTFQIKTQNDFNEAIEGIKAHVVESGVFMTLRTITETETKQTHLDRLNFLTPENQCFSFYYQDLEHEGVDITPLSEILENENSIVVVMDISEVSIPLQVLATFGRRHIDGKSFAVPLYGLWDLSVADAVATGKGYDKNIDSVAGFMKKYGIEMFQNNPNQDLDLVQRLPVLFTKLRQKHRELDLEKSFAPESFAACEFGAMTANGQRINIPLWEEMIKKTQVEISGVRKKLNDYLISVAPVDDEGEVSLNYDSPDQVLTVLKHLCFKVDGKLIDSTDATTLTKINHPVTNLLMEYRSLSKFLSNYGKKYIDAINPKTGKIHFKYRPYGTVTRRPASYGGVNALNIPRDSVIRSAFTADEGCMLSLGDWNAQEVWILAFKSGDQNMISGLIDHDDFMTYAAWEMLEMRINKEDKIRNAIKVVVYGLNYGAEAEGLQADIKEKAGLEMSLSEVKNLIVAYKTKFKTATKFLDHYSEAAAKDLRLRVAGTHRIWEIPPGVNEFAYRQHIKRAARNHPLQTYGSLMSKRAQYLANKEFLSQGLPAFFVANNYDELCAQSTSYYVEDVHRIHIEAMHQACFQVIGVAGKVSSRISYAWEK